MSTPNPVTFPPIHQGFTWVDATQNTDNTPIVPGEVTGYTIGVRADGVGAAVLNADGTVATPASYATLVVVTDPAATSETLAAFNAALKAALPAGNYWAAVQELSTTNGPSAFSAEAPFSIPSSAPPKAPTGFSVS